MPFQATEGAAGLDLFSIESKFIRQFDIVLIRTGIAIEIPTGYEGQVRPRSGNALKYGVTVVNSPGTIDSDYRGEIGVILTCLKPEGFMVNEGDRIAQLVISPVAVDIHLSVSDLSETERGEGGFGSTGTAA